MDKLSHKTVSTNHNLFEKKAEPKRNRTEVLLLTLTPYRWANCFNSPANDIFRHKGRKQGRELASSLALNLRSTARVIYRTIDDSPKDE